MSEARVRVSLTDGVLDFEGPENFVAGLVEKFTGLIQTALAAEPSDAQPAAASGHQAANPPPAPDVALKDIFAATETGVQILRALPGSTKAQRAVTLAKFYTVRTAGVEAARHRALRGSRPRVQGTWLLRLAQHGGLLENGSSVVRLWRTRETADDQAERTRNGRNCGADRADQGRRKWNCVRIKRNSAECHRRRASPKGIIANSQGNAHHSAPIKGNMPTLKESAPQAVLNDCRHMESCRRRRVTDPYNMASDI